MVFGKCDVLLCVNDNTDFIVYQISVVDPEVPKKVSIGSRSQTRGSGGADPGYFNMTSLYYMN